jgi:hypothetical protein
MLHTCFKFLKQRFGEIKLFNNEINQKYMKNVLLLLFCTAMFCSCQNERNAADMRQIMAKDDILSQLHKISSFDITGFKEDTLTGIIPGTSLKRTIRYELDISYVDSNKVQQNKKGIVLFTPDGKSIINAEITDK